VIVHTQISSLENSNSIVEYVVMRLKMSDAYNIRHCIWCGKKGFKDSQEVISHIKETHTRAV